MSLMQCCYVTPVLLYGSRLPAPCLLVAMFQRVVVTGHLTLQSSRPGQAQEHACTCTWRQVSVISTVYCTRKTVNKEQEIHLQ